MQTYDWFVSDKTSITYQAFEKFFNGVGNPQAVNIAVGTVHELTDDGIYQSHLSIMQKV